MQTAMITETRPENTRGVSTPPGENRWNKQCKEAENAAAVVELNEDIHWRAMSSEPEVRTLA